MRSVGVMHRLRGWNRLRSVAGVPAQNRSSHFTAWKQCRVKPEYSPSQHQDYARVPVRVWLCGL